jgi:hypothetical protein
MSAAQKREAKLAKAALAAGSESDLLALLHAVEGYAAAKQRGHSAAFAYADRNFLSGSTLGMIADITQQVCVCAYVTRQHDTHCFLLRLCATVLLCTVECTL